MSTNSRILAYQLLFAASEEWLLALLWIWKRGADRQYDLTPGLSGETLAQLEQFPGMWEFCRWLRAMVRSGLYQPSPYRRIWVKKPGSQKRRPIDIAEPGDWLVEKAIQVVIRELLTIGLSDACIAYRKGLGDLHALARAFRLANAMSCPMWLVADIEDAYGAVPHPRLEDLLHKLIPCRPMVDLIMKIVHPARREDGITRGTMRGIPQGSPLSPFLFNAYAAKFVDQPWQRRFPQWPLLRYADDMLVLTSTRRQAQQAHRELDALLTSAGFKLKEPKTRLVNIEHADLTWLGHTITKRNGKFSVDVPPKHWEHLAEEIASHGPEYQQKVSQEIIGGFFRYHAPTWQSRDIRLVASSVGTILGRAWESPEFTKDIPQWETYWIQEGMKALKRWRRIV